MPVFISDRLASRIQRRTEAHAYTDAGYYIPAPDPNITDTYGQVTVSTTLIPVTCSFTDKPKMETWRGDADVQGVEAEVRFATPAPSKGGKFKITERFGQTVTSQAFEIIGIQNRGTFGYVCALKAVSL
jgi:hypothetical protein